MWRAGVVIGCVAAALASTTVARAAQQPPTRAQALALVQRFFSAEFRRDFATDCRLVSRWSLNQQGLTRTGCVGMMRYVNDPSRPKDSFLEMLRAGYRVIGTGLAYVPAQSCDPAVSGCLTPPAFWSFRMSFVSGTRHACVRAGLIREGGAFRFSWPPSNGDPCASPP